MENTTDRIISYGEYRRGLRHLALRMKDGKPSALKRAAEIFAEMIPQGAVVVPMPSHDGTATTMLEVARQICAVRTDCRLADVLRAERHKSMYAMKKCGEAPSRFAMSICGELPEDRGEVCIIDNVSSSGTTAGCALEALPMAKVFVIATPRKDNQMENDKQQSETSNQPATYEEWARAWATIEANDLPLFNRKNNT